MGYINDHKVLTVIKTEEISIPEYTGSYNVTANGTLSTANKKMTQDLVVNVASSGVDVVSTYDATIPNSAMRNLNITSYTSETNTRIEGNCFWGCASLEKVYIPNGFLYDNSHFRECTSLKSVYLKGVTNYGIGRYAFYNCNSLQKVALANPDGVVPLNYTGYDTIPRLTPPIKFYVPSSLIASYQTATNWSTLYNNGYITFEDIANWGD